MRIQNIWVNERRGVIQLKFPLDAATYYSARGVRFLCVQIQSKTKIGVIMTSWMAGLRFQASCFEFTFLVKGTRNSTNIVIARQIHGDLCISSLNWASRSTCGLRYKHYILNGQLNRCVLEYSAWTSLRVKQVSSA